MATKNQKLTTAQSSMKQAEKAVDDSVQALALAILGGVAARIGVDQKTLLEHLQTLDHLAEAECALLGKNRCIAAEHVRDKINELERGLEKLLGKNLDFNDIDFLISASKRTGHSGVEIDDLKGLAIRVF